MRLDVTGTHTHRLESAMTDLTSVKAICDSCGRTVPADGMTVIAGCAPLGVEPIACCQRCLAEIEVPAPTTDDATFWRRMFFGLVSVVILFEITR